MRPDRVTAAFAGLRVLPAGEGQSVNARRETVYSRGTAGPMRSATGTAVANTRTESATARVAMKTIDVKRRAPRPKRRSRSAYAVTRSPSKYLGRSVYETTMRPTMYPATTCRKPRLPR